MNIDRIKEIQKRTAYPDSVSVQQALLQVWNECEQEKKPTTMKCINCGTGLSGGICPNCQEELFIFTEQNEYLPDHISEDFIQEAKRQKEEVKQGVNKF